MTDLSATQFGKYRLEAQVGRGGFGTVYRALDTTLERPVALKILEPLLMRDQQWVARFRREAKLMARLDHPHIVPIHEIGDVAGQLYIAMKLIEGGNLSHHLQAHGALDLAQISRILTQISAALDFAYSLKIVHRDLKPGNVLLNGQQALLTDFGFARLVGDNSQSVTASGSIVGTPAYIAPEVWEEKSQGAAGDIYALGCILYEMAAGEVLFSGESTPAIMLAHFRPPPLPGKLPADLPPRVLGVIQKALARDPAARYATASQMAQDLVQILPPQPAGAGPIQRLKEQAAVALDQGDLDAARSFITSLQALTPADTDLPRLHARLTQAIAATGDTEVITPPLPASPVAPKPTSLELSSSSPVEEIVTSSPAPAEASVDTGPIPETAAVKPGFFQRLFTLRGCLTSLILLLAACGLLTLCAVLSQGGVP